MPPRSLLSRTLQKRTLACSIRPAGYRYLDLIRFAVAATVVAYSLGGCSDQLADTHYHRLFWEENQIRGLRRLAENDYAGAVQPLMLAEQEASRLGGNDFRQGLTLSALASLHYMQSDWAEAARLDRRAIAILEAVPKTSCHYNLVQCQLVHALCGLGNALREQRLLPEAQSQVARAMEILKLLPGRAESELLTLDIAEAQADTDFATAQNLASIGDRAAADVKYAQALTEASSPLLTRSIQRARSRLESDTSVATDEKRGDPEWERLAKDPRFEKWKRIFDQGEEAVKLNNREQAETLLLQAVELSENLPQTQKPLLRSLSELASAYQLCNKSDQCEQCLATGVEIARRVKGASREKLELLLKCASFYNDRNKIQEAERQYSELLSVCGDDSSTERKYKLESCRALARIYGRQQNKQSFAKAEQSYLKALSILKDADKRESFVLLCELARTYDRDGKWQECRSVYERLLTEALGLSPTQTAELLQSAGDIDYYHLDEFARAHSSYERALSIYERLSASVQTDRQCLVLLRRLADVDVRRKHWPGVEKYRKRALTICQRLEQPDSEVILRQMLDVSNALSSQNKFEQAEQVCEDYLKTLPRMSRGKMPGIEAVYMKLGNMCWRQGKFERERRWFESVPATHQDASLLRKIAMAYFEEHNYVKAEEIFEKALASSPAADLRPTLLLRIATCKLQQGKDLEAERYRREAFRLGDIQGPEISSDYYESITAWGLLCQEKGRNNECADVFVKLRHLLEQRKRKDFDLPLGHAFCAQRIAQSCFNFDRAAAAKWFTVACSEFKVCCGVDSRILAGCEYDFANHLIVLKRYDEAETLLKHVQAVFEKLPPTESEGTLKVVGDLLASIRKSGNKR